MKKLLFISILAIGCQSQPSQEEVILNEIVSDKLLQMQVDSITEKCFENPSHTLTDRERNIIVEADSVL